MIGDIQFNDQYNERTMMSKGQYDGLGEYLLSLSYESKKAKSFSDSTFRNVMISLLPTVFNKLHAYCSSHNINLSNLLSGTINEHVLWDPYELPLLHEEIINLSSDDSKASFSYGDSIFQYIDHETTVRDKDNQQADNSWFHNDNGECIEKHGSYYRTTYSDNRYTAGAIVDYVIRVIENRIRNQNGKKELQLRRYPFSTGQSEINRIINDAVPGNIVAVPPQSQAKTYNFTVIQQYSYLSKYKFPHLRFIDHKAAASTFESPDLHLNNQQTEIITMNQTISKYYIDLFSSIPKNNNRIIKHSDEISNITIVRDIVKEKEFGIDDIKCFIYSVYGQLHITGEICSTEIKHDFTLEFTFLDKDGDIISTMNNDNYSGKQSGPFCFSTNLIRMDCFYNHYPFGTYLSASDDEIATKIVIEVQQED